MAVQWLKLHTFTEGDAGLIPSGGVKIPHVVWHGQRKNFNEHFLHTNMVLRMSKFNLKFGTILKL